MENSEQSAFPILETDTTHPVSLGLTKREYFAGLAMQGLLSNVSNNHFDIDALCKYSVECAGEILKRLEKIEII